jgi:hypothetical protein
MLLELHNNHSKEKKTQIGIICGSSELYGDIPKCLNCTECARGRGPYEVKKACRETQMHAGRVKYAVMETLTSASRWARALNFGEFSGSNSIKKHK